MTFFQYYLSQRLVAVDTAISMMENPAVLESTLREMEIEDENDESSSKPAERMQ